MPLVYLPDREVLFLWETEALARSNRPFAASGQAGTATLITPEGRREVQGRQLALLETTAVLAVYPASDLESLSASVAIWALASKLAMELIARERVVPTVAHRNGRLEARWAAALSASEDAAKVLALSRSFPPAAHAVPVRTGAALEVWSADALLRAYLDAVVDAVVRSIRGGPRLPAAAASQGAAWDERWRAALAGPDSDFEARGFSERSVV